ncbi:hypothetical protein K7432_008541 [Basidiobolus ranarum]|uniref:Retrotransposon gag domain-containing protein n=1 Tax=Basidiobolus ranarum TaxID=34480 RepID=A0ABR2VYG1_9FUNG
MLPPTNIENPNSFDKPKTIYTNLSRQLKQLMMEKDALVLEYCSLLQYRTKGNQRQNLQEVITAKRKEVAILKKNIQELVIALWNMENSSVAILNLARISAMPYPTTISEECTIIVPSYLPTFSEGPNAIKDPMEFLYKFNNVLVAYQLDKDSHWARLLPLCLTMQDAQWVQHNIPATCTWKNAQDLFYKHFQDPLKTLNLHPSLWKIKRQEGENIQHFYKRFKRNIQAAGVHDLDPSLTAMILILACQ